MIVATKCDITDQRKISKEEGENYAAELGLDHIETSAKTNLNVA